MERLKKLAALALMITSTASAHAESYRFIVAGDVPSPQVREYPAGESVSAQRLLRDVGVFGSGGAVVVRGSQPQAFTEYVYADSAGQDSFLLPGDIVIFHHPNGDRPALGNVVVACGTPGVVALSQEGNQLGSLLSRLRIEFGAETTCRVVRTVARGPKNLILSPHDRLAHGDVLILDNSMPVDDAYLESLFAAPSGPAAAVNAAQTLPPADSIDVTNSVAAPVGLMIPEPDSRSESVHSRQLDIPVSLTAMETVVPPVTDSIPPDPIASTTTPSPETSSPSANALSVQTAVLIVGLFGSFMLVVTGWFKTQREISAAAISESESAYQLRSPRESSTTEQPIVSSWAPDADLEEVPVSDEIAPLTDIFPATTQTVTTPVLSNVSRPTAEVSASDESKSDRPLVQETEWYGEQWRSADRSSEEVASEVEPIAERRPEPVSIIDPVPQILTSGVTESAATHADEAMPSVVEAADDLEDLIQNRLPVQLCEADLPLRVTLFGRPAGPRRLRVDNAHSDLAAPHFSSGSRARNQSLQKVEIAESDSGDQVRDQDQASLDRALNSLHGQGH